MLCLGRWSRVRSGQTVTEVKKLILTPSALQGLELILGCSELYGVESSSRMKCPTLQNVTLLG